MNRRNAMTALMAVGVTGVVPASARKGNKRCFTRKQIRRRLSGNMDQVIHVIVEKEGGLTITWQPGAYVDNLMRAFEE